MRSFLVRTQTLWGFFVLALLLAAAISAVVNTFHFGVIDELIDGAEIRAHLAAMSPKQRLVHAWMTGTLDVLFPLIYGSFFIGMALRFFGKLGPLFALPGILVIPADISEAVVEVFLLNGHDGLVGLKVAITSIKLALFFAGLAISFIGLLIGLGRNLLRQPI